MCRLWLVICQRGGPNDAHSHCCKVACTSSLSVTYKEAPLTSPTKSFLFFFNVPCSLGCMHAEPAYLLCYLGSRSQANALASPQIFHIRWGIQRLQTVVNRKIVFSDAFLKLPYLSIFRFCFKTKTPLVLSSQVPALPLTTVLQGHGFTHHIKLQSLLWLAKLCI